MSIFDKISSLITGSKTEKREPEKVSSSVDDAPIEVAEDYSQIKGKNPKMVIFTHVSQFKTRDFSRFNVF